MSTATIERNGRSAGHHIPTFTSEILENSGRAERPASFSRYDGLSIALVIIAVVSWIVQPHSMATGWMFAVAGLANLGRLACWYGWTTWREPLVLILHFGYGWFALSLFILGGQFLGSVCRRRMPCMRLPPARWAR